MTSANLSQVFSVLLTLIPLTAFATCSSRDHSWKRLAVWCLAALVLLILNDLGDVLRAERDRVRSPVDFGRLSIALFPGVSVLTGSLLQREFKQMGIFFGLVSGCVAATLGLVMVHTVNSALSDFSVTPLPQQLLGILSLGMGVVISLAVGRTMNASSVGISLFALAVPSGLVWLDYGTTLVNTVAFCLSLTASATLFGQLSYKPLH